MLGIGWKTVQGENIVMNHFAEPSGQLQTTDYGLIQVPLAIFWSAPFGEPVYQEISRHAAANPAQWSESLDTDGRLWLVDKVETMAIFGERVHILEEQGPWLKVAAESQITVKNYAGYPGWVLGEHVGSKFLFEINPARTPEVVIAIPRAFLYGDPALTQIQGILSYQTRLPLYAKNEHCQKVGLPGGNVGYLAPKDTQKVSGLTFSPERLITEARQFLDLPYLWGGTSSYGFDCSGFMFRLYQSQGISIPRDASEQANRGIPVAREDLLPGDLLFFAYLNPQDKIHHVGMYIGEGMMIHSPNSKSAVRIESFEEEVYGEEYWGARRYR
jgi:cell wall-associated NlpC family hydrolase